MSDGQVRRFYESRGWTGETLALLSSALEGAEHHGLHRSMFLDAKSETGNAASREAALTKAAITYAEALATGRTDPTKIREIYTIARPKSIEGEEIAPKGEAYLRRNNMERRGGWIVQLPGPDNALGEVKSTCATGMPSTFTTRRPSTSSSAASAIAATAA